MKICLILNLLIGNKKKKYLKSLGLTSFIAIFEYTRGSVGTSVVCVINHFQDRII